MNTTTTTEQTALTLAQRANVALGSSQHETTLLELVKSSADIVAVIDPAGREQAHRIGMTLKNARIAIEKASKGAREDAVQFGKAVIEEERRLIGIVSDEEERVFGLRDTFDAAVESERQAKIAAERARMEAINKRLDQIRGLPVLCAQASSSLIADTIANALDSCDMSPGRFDERLSDAVALIAETKAMMQKMFDAALAREDAAAKAEAARVAEANRIAAEREELARLRAESAERDRVAKIETDRIAAENAAEARRLADLAAKLAAEQAEGEAKLKAVKDQLAADQAALNKAEIEKGMVSFIATGVSVLRHTGDKVEAVDIVDMYAPATPPSLRLGQISERLGFAVTESFLSSLGFDVAATIKASKFYHESDFPRICDRLIQHITEVRGKKAAGGANLE